ncbi:MAG: hypothetical protein Kow00121_04000 [Elainellaceae cyanobacterium]
MKLLLPRITYSRDRLSYAALMVALLFITFAIVVPYIASQRAFLGGDINDGFYQFAIEVTQRFRQSPIAAIQLVLASLNQIYNKLFTLPLVPVLLILGDSYLAYVISLALVYLLPFCLAIGTIATQLIPVYPQAVFSSATLIAAIVVPTWTTILQGYPDISAALLIAVAIIVALKGTSSGFHWLLPDRWQVPLLGFLLGLSVLFRRHFAYAAVSVLGAIVVHSIVVFLLEQRRDPRLAWKNAIKMGIRLGLVGATSLVTLLVFAWKFTLRALTSDYVSLYDSWSRPVQEVFHFYGALYGWLVWILVVAGFIGGWRTGILAKPVTLFVSAFGVISISFWLFRLRYTETYYALHFAPFVLLGLTACAWMFWLRSRRYWKVAILSLLSGYLIVNAIAGITTAGNFQSPMRSWLAMAYPPPVRGNYDTVIELMQFLRDRTPNQEAIFVVYSQQLPMHVLAAAERTIYGSDGLKLNLEQGSPTDSDGFYPIQELLGAQYVLVTQPFVEWNAGQQQTAKALFDAFTNGWELTEDFQRLPQEFDLQAGTTTTVYQRIRPTPVDRTVRFLQTMQQQVNKPLGNQLDWIALNPPEVPTSPLLKKGKLRSVKRMKSQKYALSPAGSPASPEIPQTFLYVGNLAEQNTIKGRMVLSPQCQGTMRVSTLNAQGQVIHQAESLTFTETAPLNLLVNGGGAGYLLLEASGRRSQAQPSPESAQTCSPKIRNLVVSSN